MGGTALAVHVLKLDGCPDGDVQDLELHIEDYRRRQAVYATKGRIAAQLIGCLNKEALTLPPDEEEAVADLRQNLRVVLSGLPFMSNVVNST